VAPAEAHSRCRNGRAGETLSIFRQQFAELGQDRENGVLTDELYQQARCELERRLLEETGATETTPTWHHVK